MLPAPCLIVSDAHLGAAPPEAEQSLLRLLDLARIEAKSLVLNGDVFDFWFEWKQVMPRTGFRTLAALAALRDSGVPITWIAGNHDCWGGETLSRDVGVDYHIGPWSGSIGGWNTLIEHGDGLRDVEDAPYRRLKRVLRNPVAIWAFRNLLHPDWATAVAKRSSHTSRNMRPRDGGEGLKRVALDRLGADPMLDLCLRPYARQYARQGRIRWRVRESGRMDGRADVHPGKRRTHRARRTHGKWATRDGRTTKAGTLAFCSGVAPTSYAQGR